MESSRLRYLARCRLLIPGTRIHVQLKQIVESLLGWVNSAKNNDLVLERHCWVSVSGFGPNTFNSTDLKPKIGQETVLEYIVHRVVSVPTSNNKHWVSAHNCGMAKSIQRNGAFRFNLFPGVFLLPKLALVQVVEPRSTVISTKDVHRTLIQNYRVVSSGTRRHFGAVLWARLGKYCVPYSLV